MPANTKKPPTKSEIYAKIVDDTGLARKDVAAVFAKPTEPAISRIALCD